MQAVLKPVSRIPRDEPTLNLTVNGQEMPFLVDTGATLSSVNISNLPKSNKHISTVGVGGTPISNPVSEPVTIETSIFPFSTKHAMLIATQSPCNLLGRDLLCKMNCTIHCTPDGIFLEVPDDKSHELHQMLQTVNTETLYCWSLIEPSVSLFVSTALKTSHKQSWNESCSHIAS